MLAENTRVTAEDLRISSETERLESETDRLTAETSRITAENTRVIAEGLRITAESARVIAEDLREQSETNRMLAENTRYDAEYARYLAETSRAEAEDARAYWAAFEPLRQYSAGEKVYYLGSSYICTAVPPIGTLPTETGYWSIVVQKGDVQYATFEVDENGELFMTTTPDYAGPTFSLTEAGNLEVSI